MKRSQWAAISLNKFKNRAKETLSVALDGAHHVPVTIGFEMVTACNITCLHCTKWRKAPLPKPLTIHEWRRLVHEVRALSGPCHLIMPQGGGEPLIDARNVLDIVKLASQSGIAVSITTNATLLDEAMAQNICDSGLATLNISLDGMRPQTHDFSRNTPGTFDKVMSAVGFMKKNGRQSMVRIRAIVSGNNFMELTDMAEWVKREKLEGIQFDALRPRGNDWAQLWPKDVEGICAALDRLIELKKRGYPIGNTAANFEYMKHYFRDPSREYPEFVCGVHSNLIVRRTGLVQVCRFKGPIGDVRKNSLSEIWHSKEAALMLRDIRDCKKSCIIGFTYFRHGLAEGAGSFWHHMKTSRAA